MEYIAIFGAVILISGFLIGFLYKIYKDKSDEEKINEAANRDLTDPIADVIKRANDRNQKDRP